MFTFISAWNEFFFALVLIQDPAKKTLPLTLANFVGAEGQVQLGPLAAGALLATIPSLIFFAIIQRRLTSGLLSRGGEGMTRTALPGHRSNASGHPSLAWTWSTMPPRADNTTNRKERTSTHGARPPPSASPSPASPRRPGRTRRDPITLKFQSLAFQDSHDRRHQAIVDAWNTANPDVQVEICRAAGTAPRQAHHPVHRRHRTGHHPLRVGEHQRVRAAGLSRGPVADLSDDIKASISDGIWDTVTVDESDHRVADAAAVLHGVRQHRPARGRRRGGPHR